jgi:putative ABC transport system permease protein
MRFIFNMAWREMRASWHRLLLFFFCIAIGVGSIVGLRSLVQNLKIAVGTEARSFFYAADVRIGGNQPWKPESRQALERLSNSTFVTAHTEAIITQTMVLPANDPDAPPLMVQVRGVQEAFPLYGEVRLAGGERYTYDLLQGRGALVSVNLLSQLNLTVGDSLDLGHQTFTIRGTIERLPGNGMDFTPLPRVVIDYKDIEATGLTGFGSRANHIWLFKTPEGQDGALLKELGREFKSTPNVGWGSFRSQENFMTRLLENWERFLGTVGLAILVLGGIGISSVTRVFVQQKLKTIAILKVIGGENYQVLGAYVIQVVGLSLVGSLLGLLFAQLLTFTASRYAEGRFPIPVVAGLTGQAAFQGIGIGILVTLLFSLPPLLEIRQVKPILVLRSTAAGNRLDWLRITATLLILPGLFALAAWQSGSLKNAGIFLGWLVATTVTLNLVGTILLRTLRHLHRLPSFVLRQGINSLYRPGNQTRVILFAVGLGALSVIAIRLHQVNIQDQFNLELDAAIGDIFLIDIQKDQRDATVATLAELGGTETQLIPMLQARVVGLVRDPANSQGLPENELRQRLGGEMRVSYRATQEASEEIIAGKFWEPTASPEAEVSVEERFSRDLMLSVGDKLVFDLLGKRIEARVSSIRRVERRYSPVAAIARFNIIFRPGTLEDAPQMFIGATRGPVPSAERAQLKRVFIEQFPNVTMIDAVETIAELRKRIGEISFAVSFLGGFVLICGLLILTGSVAMTKYQRLYEAAILKTLGAEKKTIIFITLIEYSVLGLLAGLIGSAAATGLTWALSAYSFRIPWQFAPSVNLQGIAATLFLVTLVGVLASWDVIRKKPLGILRAD